VPAAGSGLDAEDGIATTEWAILMPALLLLIMTIIQFGLLFYAGQVADAAADEGLEAAQAELGSAAAGQATAEDFATAVGEILEQPQVTADRTVDTVTVTVSGQIPALFPGLDALTVTRSASGPVERFRPPS
jgi:Flp pilus assembly protein TadG